MKRLEFRCNFIFVRIALLLSGERRMWTHGKVEAASEKCIEF